MHHFASRKTCTRTSGSRGETSGRLPSASRKASATASFTLSVMKSMLFTGAFTALVSTLKVRSTPKWACQRTRLAPS